MRHHIRPIPASAGGRLHGSVPKARRTPGRLAREPLRVHGDRDQAQQVESAFGGTIQDPPGRLVGLSPVVWAGFRQWPAIEEPDLSVDERSCPIDCLACPSHAWPKSAPRHSGLAPSSSIDCDKFWGGPVVKTREFTPVISSIRSPHGSWGTTEVSSRNRIDSSARSGRNQIPSDPSSEVRGEARWLRLGFSIPGKIVRQEAHR